ncbi:WD40/YVTN/BNR-like repeat-containing protein [Alicyclobacillus dauci]|uniref:Photosynthesis system II assembly factor Ycf48/Hcf136-like domain-containing protein n=1 Tax=Alicyclobacillus dauci TaxID=1475485 RepID=A0ABY6Z5Y7_9BACL|nr:hypothetical protein [Alicyclobacillus dauci]WAH37731.1 hypothetical protein NZD86_04300 [Alicyclobacillus dauci]
MRTQLSALAGLALISIGTLAGCATGQKTLTAPSIATNTIAANETVGSAATANTSSSATVNTTGNSIASTGNTTISPTANATPPSHSTGNSSVQTVHQGGPMIPAYVPFTQFGAKALHAVSFSSTEVGYAAGDNGIYRTADGGKTWALVYASTVPVLGIQAAPPVNDHIQNVVAFTKSSLLVSNDGRYFHAERAPGNAQGQGVSNVQAVALLDDASTWVLSGGTVWASGGLDGSMSRATPSAGVQSIAAVDDNTAYASTGQSVYKTVDHGTHWTTVLSAHLKGGSWHTDVQVQGNHVAVLFYGGDAGMSQSAFILFESNDAGKTWRPVLDEGYFSADYNGVKPVVQKNVGEQPGPMALLPTGEIVFVGVDERLNQAIVTRVTTNGKVTGPYKVGPALDVTPTQMAIAVPDAQHVILVGSKAGKGAIVMSNDGGLTWSRS